MSLDNKSQVIPPHQYAGVVIFTDTGKVIGQRRDDIPGIDNSGKISTFGGTVESGEDPQTAAWRELVQEETNLEIDIEDIIPFFTDKSWRKLTGEWEARYFYFAKITDEILEKMKVFEGSGWEYIDDPNSQDIAPEWRPVFGKAFALLADKTA